MVFVLMAKLNANNFGFYLFKQKLPKKSLIIKISGI